MKLFLSSLLFLGSLMLAVPGAAVPAKSPPKPAAGSLLVIAVEGGVQVRGQQVTSGTTLASADELRAGAAGHVRLKLADGSTVSFWGPGSMVIDRIRALPKGGDTSLRLDNGRIEAAIRAPRGDTRFEVRTPVSVAMTHGALFRIAAAQSQSMTCEVAEGSVQISDSGNQGSVAVTGGLGTRVIAGRPPMKPVALLPEPHLWTGIQLVEQRRVEIPFTPLKGATSYRMIVSPGVDLYRHLVDVVLKAPLLKIGELADGDYFVRVRAIDEFGLEGAGAIVRLRMHVRPDPPSLALPPERGRLYGNSVELAWLPDTDAIAYVAQLAEDGAFRDRQREWTGLREPKVAATGLRPATYFWRVASTLRDGSQSRFSAVRTFRLDPRPVPPAPPRLEGDTLRFTWTGGPGQIFVLQLAADPGFQHIVVERHSTQPGADLSRPLQGTYYVRLRATDPDGSVGPFSDAIRIDISGPAPRASCLVQGERGVCAVYAPTAAPPR